MDTDNDMGLTEGGDSVGLGGGGTSGRGGGTIVIA